MVAITRNNNSNRNRNMSITKYKTKKNKIYYGVAGAFSPPKIIKPNFAPTIRNANTTSGIKKGLSKAFAWKQKIERKAKPKIISGEYSKMKARLKGWWYEKRQNKSSRTKDYKNVSKAIQNSKTIHNTLKTDNINKITNPYQLMLAQSKVSQAIRYLKPGEYNYDTLKGLQTELEKRRTDLEDEAKDKLKNYKLSEIAYETKKTLLSDKKLQLQILDQQISSSKNLDRKANLQAQKDILVIEIKDLNTDINKFKKDENTTKAEALAKALYDSKKLLSKYNRNSMTPKKLEEKVKEEYLEQFKNKGYMSTLANSFFKSGTGSLIAYAPRKLWSIAKGTKNAAKTGWRGVRKAAVTLKLNTAGRGAKWAFKQPLKIGSLGKYSAYSTKNLKEKLVLSMTKAEKLKTDMDNNQGELKKILEEINTYYSKPAGSNKYKIDELKEKRDKLLINFENLKTDSLYLSRTIDALKDNLQANLKSIVGSSKVSRVEEEVNKLLSTEFADEVAKEVAKEAKNSGKQTPNLNIMLKNLKNGIIPTITSLQDSFNEIKDIVNGDKNHPLAKYIISTGVLPRLYRKQFKEGRVNNISYVSKIASNTSSELRQRQRNSINVDTKNLNPITYKALDTSVLKNAKIPNEIISIGGKKKSIVEIKKIVRDDKFLKMLLGDDKTPSDNQMLVNYIIQQFGNNNIIFPDDHTFLLEIKRNIVDLIKQKQDTILKKKIIFLSIIWSIIFLYIFLYSL